MKRIFNFLIPLFFLLIVSVQNVFAINTDNDNNVNASNELQVNKDKKNVSNSKDNKDIFGDEQTFPFVAGLGKNAAH